MDLGWNKAVLDDIGIKETHAQIAGLLMEMDCGTGGWTLLQLCGILVANLRQTRREGKEAANFRKALVQTMSKCVSLNPTSTSLMLFLRRNSSAQGTPAPARVIAGSSNVHAPVQRGDNTALPQSSPRR